MRTEGRKGAGQYTRKQTDPDQLRTEKLQIHPLNRFSLVLWYNYTPEKRSLKITPYNPP